MWKSEWVIPLFWGIKKIFITRNYIIGTYIIPTTYGRKSLIKSGKG
jgi:hypothetical protein